jgi:uncharacterized protein YndB with AHSA1/START domain
LTIVSKSIDIKTPIDNVFTYFARPEHVSDQIKNDAVGMTVVPMDIKEGMGVGTTFRVIGDFSGKRLEWDCETTEFDREERIAAKMI